MAIDPDELLRTTELRSLRAVAAGDQAAFARLAGKHGRVLLRFARSLLGDVADAEDVVQETLISLWESAGSWSPQARLSTWLHRVCYNRAVDRLRARRNFADLAAAEEQADAAPLAETVLLQAERWAGLRAAIEGLPHRQRTAVALFHLQELPQADCAAVMGVSESAFESLLARARRGLKAAVLESRHGSGGDHA